MFKLNLKLNLPALPFHEPQHITIPEANHIPHQIQLQPLNWILSPSTAFKEKAFLSSGWVVFATSCVRTQDPTPRSTAIPVPTPPHTLPMHTILASTPFLHFQPHQSAPVTIAVTRPARPEITKNQLQTRPRHQGRKHTYLGTDPETKSWGCGRVMACAYGCEYG